MNTEKTSAISEELATQELSKFYNHFSLKPVDTEQVLEELDIALIAVMDGLLSFDEDMKPKFKLKDPIKNQSGGMELEEVIFKTRIFPKDHIRLSKGLNLQKDAMQYALKCQVFLADLKSEAFLNKFSKFDYAVIQQLTTVFA